MDHLERMQMEKDYSLPPQDVKGSWSVEVLDRNEYTFYSYEALLRFVIDNVNKHKITITYEGEN